MNSPVAISDKSLIACSNGICLSWYFPHENVQTDLYCSMSLEDGNISFAVSHCDGPVLASLPSVSHTNGYFWSNRVCHVFHSFHLTYFQLDTTKLPTFCGSIWNCTTICFYVFIRVLEVEFEHIKTGGSTLMVYLKLRSNAMLVH
jgi:hypothetical protein